MSRRAVRPSTHPNACNASRNAVTRSCASGSLSAMEISTAMRRIAPPCCARAASGHAAAPPRSVMNSRRLKSNMGIPPAIWPCFTLLDRFGHHGGVVMDNEPPPVAPFVDEGISCLHRFGRTRRLAGEKKRVGPDIRGCIATDPDCAGIDNCPRVALDEMEKIFLH